MIKKLLVTAVVGMTAIFCCLMSDEGYSCLPRNAVEECYRERGYPVASCFDCQKDWERRRQQRSENDGVKREIQPVLFPSGLSVRP